MALESSIMMPCLAKSSQYTFAVPFFQKFLLITVHSFLPTPRFFKFAFRCLRLYAEYTTISILLSRSPFFATNSIYFALFIIFCVTPLIMSSPKSAISSPRIEEMEVQIINPEFIHNGNCHCIPIPRDSPIIRRMDIFSIKARNETKKSDDKTFDQSYNAQHMMKGEWNDGEFTHISLPFRPISSLTGLKGVYICISNVFERDSPPSHLIFTFTSSKGEKISKKYDFFKKIYGDYWYFLPVDLSDVVLCEITGKGRIKSEFKISSLAFIREETPEETIVYKTRDKLWCETPVVKPEFIKEGRSEIHGGDSIPIPRDDPTIVDPLFSMVKGKLDSMSKESESYEQNFQVQKMLKGECSVTLSHLSIPFPSPCPMKGAYICVHKYLSSPSLLFTFTDCDGKKTFKKYEFTRAGHSYEWYFLHIDLDNVVLCEIEGKGRWNLKKSRDFCIQSLVFTMPEEPSGGLATKFDE
ncbi:hypothetical protein ADUPG1_009075 [Aduncisulcus paluster]|uniref:Uncharacterized protein n=1 Tax=Aduncisulcus paluster TaxID=2918883 RepID=A0ABQ5KX76_9EUKA|nr:hypothetical protein ADUPG1_009075 [Aduncisulcus paluster]